MNHASYECEYPKFFLDLFENKNVMVRGAGGENLPSGNFTVSIYPTSAAFLYPSIHPIRHSWCKKEDSSVFSE